MPMFDFPFSEIVSVAAATEIIGFVEKCYSHLFAFVEQILFSLQLNRSFFVRESIRNEVTMNSKYRPKL